MLFVVASWSWILFHVLLHPLRELSFIAETKTYTFAAVWLESSVNVVARLSSVLGSVSEPVGLRHGVDMDRVLQG